MFGRKQRTSLKNMLINGCKSFEQLKYDNMGPLAVSIDLKSSFREIRKLETEQIFFAK